MHIDEVKMHIDNERLYDDGANAPANTSCALRIETARLVLRPFAESDAAAASDGGASPSARRFLPDMVWETEADALDFIRRYNAERFDESVPRVILAAVLKDGGKYVGFAGVGPKPELDGEIELGYMISEEHRNRGFAEEAARAMVWWAFERAGLDVLSAVSSPGNKASRRVLEKLGFAYGGERALGDAGVFEYFRLYHTDDLPGPEWDIRNVYPPERMGDFFDARASGYNEHMLSIGPAKSDDAGYVKFGSFFPETDKRLDILDIGCGTGLELDYIWRRAPNAHIACLDISRGMLDLLLADHPHGHDRINIIEASFADWEYPPEAYDIVASNAAMHHFWHDEKIAIYKKILGTLKPGGYYIEGDFIVDGMHSEAYRRRYEMIVAGLPYRAEGGEYHIDIAFTVEVQVGLLRAAGFSAAVVLDDHVRLRGSGAILKATK
jgi:tRNA (cmo5U34)-methyltransferase